MVIGKYLNTFSTKKIVYIKNLKNIIVKSLVKPLVNYCKTQSVNISNLYK